MLYQQGLIQISVIMCHTCIVILCRKSCQLNINNYWTCFVIRFLKAHAECWKPRTRTSQRCVLAHKHIKWLWMISGQEPELLKRCEIIQVLPLPSVWAALVEYNTLGTSWSDLAWNRAAQSQYSGAWWSRGIITSINTNIRLVGVVGDWVCQWDGNRFFV